MARDKTKIGKVRLEIDPHNRLIIKKTGKKSRLSYFRQVLDGRFKTTKNNTLTYHIKAPSPKGTELPHQVKLDGKWSLDEDHKLCLTLNKWGRQTLGDKLTIQTDIISASKNSIAFSLTTKSKDNTQSVYILELKGAWQADKNNRLTFRAQKEKGSYDILTFRGAWEINKNHQIIYRCSKDVLIRKKKKLRVITFKGHWDISDKYRICYVLDKQSGSVFNFKTSAGIFKDKYIKCELGIGLSRKEEVKRIITLYGKWKIKKKVGLIFEVEYAKKEIYAITFGAQAQLTSKNSIKFELKDEKGKAFGSQLTISHKILGRDGSSFLRLLKSKDEQSLTLGAGLRW